MLVAALHYAANGGGRVTWNEAIGRRQFDVTIRFRHGMHDYLTVIECKDQKTPVSDSDVEAFVTKARGVQANKAVVNLRKRLRSLAQLIENEVELRR